MNFLEFFKNIEQTYGEKKTNRLNIPFMHIAFLEGQIAGLKHRSNTLVEGECINSQNEDIKLTEGRIYDPNITPNLLKELKKYHEESLVEALPEEAEIRSRLPNIPTEAYKVENGKKTVDKDILNYLKDTSTSKSFRCPHCLQSSIISCNDDSFEELIVRDIFNPYLLYILKKENYIEFVNKENEKLSLELKDYNDYFNPIFLNLFYSSDLFKEISKDKSKRIEIENREDIILKCNVCEQTASASKFIEAFEKPYLYTEKEAICPLCGYELEVINSASTKEGVKSSKEELNHQIKTKIKCSNKKCDY